MNENLKKYIRDIPDFPKKGILFRDITTLLSDPAAFKTAIDQLAERFAGKGITKVVGIESRGFLTAAPLAYLLGAGFIPVRKKGKLPHKTTSVTYSLEYGEDTLEIHLDAFKKGEKILIADDLLATGGTAKATCELVEKNGGKVAGIGFLIELSDLKGRDKIKGYDIESLMVF
ncbi:adenine phosphoribosyltransferase [bacterium F11]|nr:adenine phosphoribosyltransferase [bacterium F11]